MEGYVAKGGKKILQLCMGDNYHNPMVVFREYVQNAVDSIYEAEKQGLIDVAQDEAIIINLNHSIKEVEISDRGTGVKASEIGPVLVDVGSSTKNGYDQIGNYGIGRLVGANWCDQIIFETSAHGEDIKSILTFDCEKARHLIGADNDLDFISIIGQVTTLSTESENLDEHYLRVRLKNAKTQLLDIDAVKKYLSLTAPVPFSHLFLDESISPLMESCEDFRTLIAREKNCILSLMQDDSIFEIEKPYAPSIYFEGNNRRMSRPIFFKLSHPDFGLLAWGWYSLREDASQMNDLWFKGIQLRKLNMAIGSSEYLAEYFPRPVDATYFVGEIYITHPNIQPSGSRDGLKPSLEQEVFIALLKNKFASLKKNYYNLSKLGSEGFDKLIKTDEALKLAKIIYTQEPSEEHKNDVKKAQEDDKKARTALRKWVVKLVKDKEIAPAFTLTLDFWKKKAKAKISETNSKQRPGEKLDVLPVEKIVETIKKELDTPVLIPSPDSDPTPALNPNPGSNSPTAATSTPTPKETDIFRMLGKSEHTLMKKIYAIINGETRLDPKTKERLKKKIEKKLLG